MNEFSDDSFPDYMTPFYRAVFDRDFPRAKKLIDEGFSLADQPTDEGHSLLHKAAPKGDLELARFLLTLDCSRILNSFDYIQHTPLMWAAKEGHIEVVELLLSHGAEVDANDEEHIGNTAIREAVCGGHLEIVKLLLNAGAEPTIPGWMMISAVDQAYYEVAGGIDSPAAQSIRALLEPYASPLRTRCAEKNPRS